MGLFLGNYSIASNQEFGNTTLIQQFLDDDLEIDVSELSALKYGYENTISTLNPLSIDIIMSKINDLSVKIDAIYNTVVQPT